MDLRVLAAELVGMTAETVLDVLPVALFMIVFHRLVLKERFANGRRLAAGFTLVVIGLALFLLGLEKALFPAGHMMVEQLAAFGGGDGTASWLALFVFAFAIAFGAAMAEPALLAVATRVNDLSGGAISAQGLRTAAALGVATGVTVGCVRIVTGIPLHWCLAVGYLIIIVQTFSAPRAILPVAYDTGGVSTTAVTVPVVTALGLGLAEQVPGRSPMGDGFGLIALACVYPVITVLAYAQVATLLAYRRSRRRPVTDASTER